MDCNDKFNLIARCEEAEMEVCLIIEGSRDKCPLCEKNHIDLRVADGERKAVEWETQFDLRFGDDKKQRKSCFDACKLILENAGLKPDAKYQIATEIPNVSDEDQKDQKKYLQINEKEAQEGLTYMDLQLEEGHPVIVGVDHTYEYKVNDNKVDHFVVIVGRSCDDGKAFYYFYEVGAYDRINGKSDENKLHRKDFWLSGSTAYTKKRKYVVTQIRRNIPK